MRLPQTLRECMRGGDKYDTPHKILVQNHPQSGFEVIGTRFVVVVSNELSKLRFEPFRLALNGRIFGFTRCFQPQFGHICVPVVVSLYGGVNGAVEDSCSIFPKLVLP